MSLEEDIIINVVMIIILKEAKTLITTIAVVPLMSTSKSDCRTIPFVDRMPLKTPYKQ